LGYNYVITEAEMVPGVNECRCIYFRL